MKILLKKKMNIAIFACGIVAIIIIMSFGIENKKLKIMYIIIISICVVAVIATVVIQIVKKLPSKEPQIDTSILERYKEDFEKIMLVNLFAPYFICQKIIPRMKQNKFGKIINISSDLSMRTVKNATEYSMTKAGLDALTRSIAVEYGEYGITANSVNINGMKGYTTKVNEDILFSKEDKDYDDWKQSKERIPLSRRGNFSEFVDVIEFLCSNKSSYINGVNLPVDGGIIAKL